MARLIPEQMGLPLVSRLPALPVVGGFNIGGPMVFPIEQTPSLQGPPLAQKLHRPFVDADCMEDPLLNSFYLDIWNTIAENNTKIYPAVFRCMPDSQARGWDDYQQYLAMIKDRVRNGVKPVRPNQGREASLLEVVPQDLWLLTKRRFWRRNTGERNEKVEDLRGKIRGVLHKRSASEKTEDNKGQLRAWAADANRAQAERAARDCLDLEKLPVIGEKTIISTLMDGRAANGTANRMTLSLLTTLADELTPSSAINWIL